MDAEKAEFLRNRLIPVLKKIPSDKAPLWGKMTLQQMVEHMSDFVRIASGKTPFTDVITPPDRLDKAREFMESDKPFRENTANPMLPETPAPVKNASLELALKELDGEIRFFFDVFEKNNMQVTRNPIFGDLNYAQNIHLLHKHSLHHLRQFGVVPENAAA